MGCVRARGRLCHDNAKPSAGGLTRRALRPAKGRSEHGTECCQTQPAEGETIVRER